MENEKRTFYDKEAIAERYQIGISKASEIIRAIRHCCGGGQLPAGKVLPAELEWWENKYKRMTPVFSSPRSVEKEGGYDR